MATQEKTWNVANRLHSLKDSDNPEVNHIIAGADEIYDDTKGAKQSDINAQTDAALADRYTKAETYSKEQLDSLITTPDANYVTVATFADLPQTGEANTIYRVSSYDGTQVDASKYALYAWNGATYQLLAVRSAVGEVFDVSEYNSGATYETLTAALAAVPASVQRGGMSIKFILRTNTGTEEEPVYHDEYVLYRLMNTDWSTVAGDWQGVDSELIAGSRNLVESGVVHNELALGAVYDVSAKNPTAGPNNDGKFESLSALLSDANLNTLIPTAYRKGGMSIKFVQSSDNKYVQYRLMSETFNTTVANWQGVDDEPMADSKNLAESGGIYNQLNVLKEESLDFTGSYVGGYIKNNNGDIESESGAAHRIYYFPCSYGDTFIIKIETENPTQIAYLYALYSSDTTADFDSTHCVNKPLTVKVSDGEFTVKITDDTAKVIAITKYLDNTYTYTLSRQYYVDKINDTVEQAVEQIDSNATLNMLKSKAWSISGNVVYDTNEIPQSYNIIWNDGTSGTVLMSNFNGDVFEYTTITATYQDKTIVYGLTYDENGYITNENITIN